MTPREPMWRRYDRFFGANRRADADDELRFHLEMRVQDYMRAGMSEVDARKAAEARMGKAGEFRDEVTSLAETHTRRDHRRERFEEVRQDVRYGLRTLARSPAFTVVAVLTLGLAIGATTSIFSVVHRVLVAPLPYTDPSRLVRIYERAPQGRNDENPVSSGNYIDWRTRAKSFSGIGAHAGAFDVAMTGDGEPTLVTALSATPSTFTMLGVRPLRGRVFTAEDADAPAVVVLSEGFWTRRFGGDTAVIGRTVTLNGVARRIVGVLPRSFEYPHSGIDMWGPVPNSALDPAQRRSHNYNVTARLADGVTVEQAQAEMSGLARAIAAEHPEFMKDWDVSVERLHADIVEDSAPLLIVLISAAVVVLLIACGNLANLLLARAVVREREFVLRGALGAGRVRLVRQLLTESLLIAVSGGVLGVVVAAVSLDSLLAAAPPLPFRDQTSIDWTVVGFAAAVTLLSTIVFGLAPALRMARVDLQMVLRTATGATGGVRHARLRAGLLTAQIALSVTLLVGAGLLIRSFQRLQSVEFGYRTENLATFRIDLPRARYQDIPQQVQFHTAMLERVAAVPGVAAVAGTSVTPGQAFPSTWSFVIEGRTSSNASGREDPQPMHFVAHRYFETLGIALRGGRTFNDFDRAGAPLVAVINESLARLHWPNEDAVGKRISTTGQNGPWIEIVGVVADTRMASPDAAPGPVTYVPYAQKTQPWLSWMEVLVRTSAGTDPITLLPALRAAVWTLDAQLPVANFVSVQELYAQTIARRSFAMALVTAFGVLALLLSAIGLFGLASYGVAQQRREIGVRLALGASAAQIVTRVLGQSAQLATIGVIAGLAGAAALTRLMTALLYAVSPYDAATFVLTATVVVVVALGAALIPAIRAGRTEPLAALRS